MYDEETEKMIACHRWRDVRKELPDETPYPNGDYLTLNRRTRESFLLDYFQGKWIDIDGEDHSRFVTHWRPIYWGKLPSRMEEKDE